MLTSPPCPVALLATSGRLTNVLVLAPGILADAPLLAKWFKAMGERKGLKAYLDSGRQKDRINNVPIGLEPVV